MIQSPTQSTLLWRKASASGDGSNSCVEVADAGQMMIAVRDSKNPAGPHFTFSRREIGVLASRIRQGQLDL